MEEQLQQPSKWKKFIRETIRVLRITKKPNKVEYLSVVKVTGLGIAIIGIIGFVVFLIRQYFF